MPPRQFDRAAIEESVKSFSIELDEKTVMVAAVLTVREALAETRHLLDGSDGAGAEADGRLEAAAPGTLIDGV